MCGPEKAGVDSSILSLGTTPSLLGGSAASAIRCLPTADFEFSYSLCTDALVMCAAEKTSSSLLSRSALRVIRTFDHLAAERYLSSSNLDSPYALS